MTNYIVKSHGDCYLNEWMNTRFKIFSGLSSLGDHDELAWKKAFFHCQALIEKFIISLFGEESMTDWAIESAKIYAMTNTDEDSSESPIKRIASQASLYGSQYEIIREAEGRTKILIQHCAIWDYRESARHRNVPITLESPCTYCTRSMSMLIRAKNCVPNFKLHDCGCEWTAIRSIKKF